MNYRLAQPATCAAHGTQRQGGSNGLATKIRYTIGMDRQFLTFTALLSALTFGGVWIGTEPTSPITTAESQRQGPQIGAV